MRKLFLMILLALAALPLAAQDNITLVIHGGAGTLTPSRIPPDEEREYAAALELALRMGHAVLAGSGSSVAAVEAAIRVLEDSPLFNAGKGAVLTRDGLVQLDASIMDGRTRRAGAVATVSTIKNPITGARLVMENSPHVMMSGPGAEAFAASQGAEIVDPSYFLVDKDPTDVRPRPVRRGFLSVPEWWNAVAGRGSQNGVASRESRVAGQSLTKYGTVGAVALDRGGNLAAGTSTGGLQNKLSGRIGDSPIIGAGTYADNQTAAISGTGIGEFFMRNVVAYDIAALMKYRGLTVSQAAADAIARLTQQGAPAGVIALDAAGNFTMPFNTDGMFRGFVRGDGVPHVFIFRD